MEIGESRMRTTVTCALALLALALPASAVDPPPDGGYPGGNTAEGTDALFSVTIGTDNTASGFHALLYDTTGSSNTAVGSLALFDDRTGSNNTALGFEAMFRNRGGEFNTATGYLALLRNMNGNDNTANGENALARNTTGSNNIALGASAGFHLTIGDNNIDIGNKGVTDESNTIRIGIKGTQQATFIAGIHGTTTVNMNAVPVVIDSDGQLGTVSSSARFKDEIKPMDKASETILGLKPVTFHYKSDNTGTAQFGLIAEEVAKANPDLVVREENGEPYTVRYDAVNAMLLNEFLKEHQKVEQQGATIAREQKDFESKIAQQQKDIEALRTGLQKVSDELQMSKAAPRMISDNQ
jgi:hypothetical protein